MLRQPKKTLLHPWLPVQSYITMPRMPPHSEWTCAVSMRGISYVFHIRRFSSGWLSWSKHFFSQSVLDHWFLLMPGPWKGQAKKCLNKAADYSTALEHCCVSDLSVCFVRDAFVPWSALFIFNKETWMPLQPLCAFCLERLAEEQWLREWDQRSRFGCFISPVSLSVWEAAALVLRWVTHWAAAKNNASLLPHCGCFNKRIRYQNSVLPDMIQAWSNFLLL